MGKYRAGYQQLNWLLSDCLEAERRYFDASEDIQDSELKRFLNHESVNRNNYAQKIAEKLLQAGIEPYKYNTKKGNLHRNWLDVKKVLTSNNWKKQLIFCMKQDERCLKRYWKLLKETELPADVSQLVQEQRNNLLQSLDKATLFKNRDSLQLPKKDPKVIKLKAM